MAEAHLSPDPTNGKTTELEATLVDAAKAPASGAVPPAAAEPAAKTAKKKQPVDEVPRGSWIRRLRRVLTVLITVGAVAAGIYYGWPLVDERVIQPIRQNTASVSAVEGRVVVTESQLSELQAQVDAIISAEAVVPDRLTALEGGLADLTSAQSDLDARLATTESLIAGHTSQLASLDNLQEALDANLSAATAAASRQLSQLKSMELMSRARLFLYQANYGLAEQDILAARDLMATTVDGAVVADAAVAEELIFRLDKAAEALPDLPVVAADDLDIAWQLLLTTTPVGG